MKIYLGADHAGFQLKEEIKIFLHGLGYEVSDEGAFVLDENDDYPDFISIVAKEVAGNPGSRGIVFGGSGQGEAISANRFNCVRAVVWYGGNMEVITLSREHNDANILSIGARFVSGEEVKEAIKLWLDTDFPGDERHERRIKKLDNLR